MTSAIEDDLLHRAARASGLRASDARQLWRHATSVYLLPAERLVARLTVGDDAADAARRAVAVTRWLRVQGFPVVEPAAVDQPFFSGDHTVTFWRYYPQDRPTSVEPWRLGELLRVLHRLPEPPIELQVYQPLQRLGATVISSTSLNADERQWLLDQRARLLEAYAGLDFPLGVGHIHGDAYPGNLLWHGDDVLLADWDETAIGPRELDLVNTHHGTRFGRTVQQLDAFDRAYGSSLRTWSGFSVLRAIRDLHTLGSYIRRADRGDHTAMAELRHRLVTLQQGNITTRWQAR